MRVGFIIALALASSTGAGGCGLALDYDPPSDSGVGFDAPALDTPVPDVPGCSCPAGETCRPDGSCGRPCTRAVDCSTSTGCAACVAGVCEPPTTCPTSSCLDFACSPDGTCTTMDECTAPEACIGDACVSAPCRDGSNECDAFGTDECGLPYACIAGRCQRAPMVCVPARGCIEYDACCRPMPNDALCAGGLTCSVALDGCVGCESGSDCESGVCDPVTHLCACLDGCRHGLSCVDGLCTTCRDDACVSMDPTRPFCDAPSGRCVGCVDDSDCGTRRCLVEPGGGRRCVQCLVDDDCPGAFACAADNTCGECGTTSPCIDAAVCSPTGDCGRITSISPEICGNGVDDDGDGGIDDGCVGGDCGRGPVMCAFATHCGLCGGTAPAERVALLRVADSATLPPPTSPLWRTVPLCPAPEGVYTMMIGGRAVVVMWSLPTRRFGYWIRGARAPNLTTSAVPWGPCATPGHVSAADRIAMILDVE